MTAIGIRSGRACCAVLAAVTLFALPLPGAAIDPYELDVIAPMSGNGAFIGRALPATFAAIEDVVNKSGGIGGRPVHFVILDDQSNPQVALQLANDLVAKQVPIILGPSLSATCNAICLSQATAPGCWLPNCNCFAWTRCDGTYVQKWSVSRTYTLQDQDPKRADYKITVTLPDTGFIFDTQDAAKNYLSPFGTASRNPGRTPAFNETDLDLNKKFNTPLENMKIEFRAEAYNVLNHTNLYLPGNISGSQGTTSYTLSTGASVPLGEITGGNPTGGGQITSTFEPRIIQFGLKVIY